MATPAERLERQMIAAVTSAKPHVPEAGRLLWGWFRALHRARSYGMAGPNPISYAEIEAFARTERLPLEPRHVDLLRRMDAAWIKWARDDREGHGAGGPSRTTSQAISPGAFDAVFA